MEKISCEMANETPAKLEPLKRTVTLSRMVPDSVYNEDFESFTKRLDDQYVSQTLYHNKSRGRRSPGTFQNRSSKARHETS